ncbi:hypothetical protein Tco_1367575 [Tanacetum coccineum]
MESNKSIHISDEQKNLYKALVNAYESDKLILDTYRETVSFKRRRDKEDKDEEPSARSNRGSKRRRARKEPESTSAPKEKTSKTIGKSTEGSKSYHKSADESTEAEEPIDDDKLYTFKEGDLNRLRIQDIEDMLLLLIQGKLTNLTVEERLAFNVSLRIFTRSIVIQRHVEDLQLGVESYQKKLNLTNPDTLMRIDELHKFSDGTLNDVWTALDDRLKGIRVKYLPQTIWRQSNRDKAGAMIQAIDKQLKTRRIMWRLEKFIDKMDSMHSTLSMYYDYDAHVKGELLELYRSISMVYSEKLMRTLRRSSLKRLPCLLKVSFGSCRM